MSSSQNNNLSRVPTPPPPLPSLSQALNNERRTWTREEEDALIVILKKLVVDGWRQENAFRTGYLNVALTMLQAHPKVKSLRGKSYRYYHDWVEIFGKDRATGKNAQGPEDLAKASNEEPYIPYFDPNEFPHIHTENVQNEFQSRANEHVHNDIHHDVVPIEEEIADNPSPDERNSGNAKKKDGGNKSQSRFVMDLFLNFSEGERIRFVNMMLAGKVL
ncbi:hypothetical protein OROMI_005559 [Orobanche minor]